MKIKYAYAVIAIGIVLGVFGFVRSGAVLISIGASANAYLRFQRSKKKRKIELAIPLALAFTLFVVALTLPHGK